jgi:hypothetical protein
MAVARSYVHASRPYVKYWEEKVLLLEEWIKAELTVREGLERKTSSLGRVDKGSTGCT